MLNTALASIIVLPILSLSNVANEPASSQHVIGSETISLETRHPVPQINQVYKDNILLTIANARDGASTQPIDYQKLNQPFKYEFKLEADKTFSFHDDILPQYEGKVAKTTNSHFGGQEGFKSDGYLMGNGVCHLASLINRVGQEAGLDVNAPSNHDFALIPEISREYGTAIYSMGGDQKGTANQNLYITNNHGKEVYFVFEYDGQNLKVEAVEKS